MKSLLFFVSALCLFITIVAGQNLCQRVSNDPDLSIFLSIVETFEYGENLQTAGLTLFAPTNASFDDFHQSGVNFAMLENHMIVGRAFEANEIRNNLVLQSLSTLPVRFNVYEEANKLTINGRVITPGIISEGSVLHKIDGVITEPIILAMAAELISLTPSLSYLYQILESTNLFDSLNKPGNFTIFAASNEAFASFLQVNSPIEEENAAIFSRILSQHVISDGVWYSAGFFDNQSLHSSALQPITIEFIDDMVNVNGAVLITKDITLLNGVLHIIDKVLVPSFNVYHSLILQERFVLRSLLFSSDLRDTLSEQDVTLFAPTEDSLTYFENAFNELNPTERASILQYHVLAEKVSFQSFSNDLLLSTLEGSFLRVNVYSNRFITVNGKELLGEEIVSSNGLIHSIDGVLTPPVTTILEFLGGEDFSILKSAVEAAGLQDILSTPNNFTLFAPTDLAFEPFGEYLPNLFANPETLRAILLYHLLPSTFFSVGLADGEYSTSLVGNSINITSESMILINDQVPVVDLDFLQTNGVVHSIQGILIPPRFFQYDCSLLTNGN